MGYCRKKADGGVKDMDFPGVLEKEHVEIPGVLVFDLGVTKGRVRKCNTAGIQRVKLQVKGKVTNLKFPGGFQKSVSSTSCGFFWNSPFTN